MQLNLEKPWSKKDNSNCSSSLPDGLSVFFFLSFVTVYLTSFICLQIMPDVLI